MFTTTDARTNPTSRLSWQAPACAALVAGLLATAACERFQRPTLPDMGPQIPVSVKLEFDPLLTGAKVDYIDACNSPHEIKLGEELEAVVTEAAFQNFKAVQVAGVKTDRTEKPEVEIRLVLQQKGLKLNTDNVYDRIPAELTLEATAGVRDASGNTIGELPLKTVRTDKLLLEPTQHRCDYASMGAFIRDASIVFASQFIRDTRALLDPNRPQAAVAQPVGAPPSLAFKATLLDENGNLILEGGERVKVRVDVTNSGKVAVVGAAATLSGTPGLITSFPSTGLQIGSVPPGESRSVEFAATVPPSMEAQRAEVTVTVSVASGSAAPPPQTLTASLRGAVGRLESIDQIPTSTGLQRPHTYVLAIGLSAYRDPRIEGRKFAALDAELVAGYLQAVGGVPPANVRLLQDWKALRNDLEDSVLEWLPRRLTSESVVIVYFSGHAAVSPSGDTYLVPYDGKHTSTARLYALKDLETGLARLKAKQTLFIFDGGMLAFGQAKAGKGPAPKWSAGKGSVVRLIGSTGLRGGLEPDKLRHGLFTYYLLRGLKGDADANFNGEVTLGELTAYLGRIVPASARQDFNQEQRPLIIPPVQPAGKSADLVLAKTASAR
jgi:hypothetical protein